MIAPKIARHWPRAAAVEIDRTTFVALWVALDRAADVAYLYDEYVAPLSALPVHADAVRKRGIWIPAVFDPEARGRDKAGGIAIAERLVDLGVGLFTAPLSEEAGVLAVGERLVSGRLRAADTLTRWTGEYETWQRDAKGDLPEEGGLLMRATAMLIQSGLLVAVTENQAASDAEGYDMGDRTRSKVTGY